jgi:NAD(P)-dependent dehydrogenase (short-subunit alcohol dehydrogenase family)
MGNMDEITALFGLEGKVAVVTGAATGIGREIARLFHAAGAKVIGADINEAELATLPQQCPGSLVVRLDQGDPESIKALFASVDEQAGPIDILVNCAAIYPFKPFEEVDTAFLDRMIDINLRGVFQCVQEAVKRMKVDDRGGSIVNIASVNSLRACIFDNVHYGVTKAGVNNLTVSVALEYAPHNIRVNSVLPGAVGTAQAGKAADGYPLRGPFTQSGRMPLTGTVCAPQDIANACLFLASGASRYVTGQLLAVDGGFLIS